MTDLATARSASGSLAAPGIVLGVGLGGFVDGIVLHQILQWHHMLTSTGQDRLGLDPYPATTVHGLEMNTLWDGLFHTFTWLAVLLGLALLYGRLSRPDAATSPRRALSSRALWGWVLCGWGLFNLVEGTISHHILGIHHVRSGEHQTLWDIGFLVLGALLVLGGWLLQRSANRTSAEAEPRTADVPGRRE